MGLILFCSYDNCPLEAATKPGALGEAGPKFIYLTLWGGSFAGNSWGMQRESALGATAREEETEHHCFGCRLD